MREAYNMEIWKNIMKFLVLQNLSYFLHLKFKNWLLLYTSFKGQILWLYLTNAEPEYSLYQKAARQTKMLNTATGATLS